MAKLIHKEHDRFFKKSMENPKVAREFFEKNLDPKLLTELNLSTLEFQNPAKISQWLKLTEADVLYSVKMEDGRHAYFYILLEHQSTHTPIMPFRILVYQVDTMKMYHDKYPKEPLPIVYPIVLYSGTTRWTSSRDLFELFGNKKELAKETFLQPFKLIDLHRIDDEILKNQLWAGIFQYAMKHRKGHKLAETLKILLLWVKNLYVEYEDAEIAKIVLYYLLKDLNDDAENLFIKSINECLPEDLIGEAMTIAEKLRNEGIDEGIDKGIVQGLEKTACNMLLEDFPLATIAKITGLSLAQIKKLQLETHESH